eukprot:CAMPEP_0172446068 /NCGR_PEP_ID=MMETSP1065-20121228/5748_1 /TAXON_ID=265537 /ORGANISM="Amphiprora paludosa, Strain CCMP125" /LENGTH=214 /DNA_ID=CAMNT_0013197087 /DNA_START=269 /DNA_END=913 /DNA_ORIENTATION=+
MLYSSAILATIFASSALVAKAKLVIPGAPPMDDEEMQVFLGVESNGSRRRHLNGKKGGSVCRKLFYDGEDRPLLCDFPVVIKEFCQKPSQELEGENIFPSGPDELTGWFYFNTAGYEVVNLDNHKTYLKGPTGISSKQTTALSAPGQIIDFTFIGTELLSDTDPSTGAESEGIPTGPGLLDYDGYWEGTINTDTFVYSNVVVDATIIDICAELA